MYVTDALRAAYRLDRRYQDIIEPRPDFDAEEVAEAVIRKAGLEG